MDIYLAPLEGITGNIFRSELNKICGGVDKYFTPFITPSDKSVLSHRIEQDVLPQNNVGQQLVPQILTNSSKGFIEMCKRLEQYGYKEFNLNLGCPSGTVVSKGRGSGFLAYTDELDKFLEDIFSSNYKISVKTRIGKNSAEEFCRLLEIYNQYPMTELIIHPRTREDMYKNTPDLDTYEYAVKNSKNTLCYNGDIFSVADYNRFIQKFSDTKRVMIGRGVVKNPMLPIMIKTGCKADKNRIKCFYDAIYADYEKVLYGNVPLMHKMKEVMTYMLNLFDCDEKIVKKVKKSKNIRDFNLAINELFSGYEIS